MLPRLRVAGQAEQEQSGQQARAYNGVKDTFNDQSRESPEADPDGGNRTRNTERITLEIKSGESVAIVGASGSGKSTLLGLLAGLDEASGGRVVIGDTDLGELDEDGRPVPGPPRGFRIPVVPVAARAHRPGKRDAAAGVAGQARSREQAEAFLQRVGLGPRMRHYPRQLSGGEQQRVAIARAFAAHPPYCLPMNPPAISIPALAAILSTCCSNSTGEGTTLVLVTHDAQLADRCERRICLEAGAVVEA